MDDIRAVAFMSWGRWVANCPAGCGNAEHYGPDPETGHIGGLSRASFTCGSAGHGCGLTCAAVWPDNIVDIEAMLAGRPMRNRNWTPGETPQDLLAENLEHGIIRVEGVN